MIPKIQAGDVITICGNVYTVTEVKFISPAKDANGIDTDLPRVQIKGVTTFSENTERTKVIDCAEAVERFSTSQMVKDMSESKGGRVS